MKNVPLLLLSFCLLTFLPLISTQTTDNDEPTNNSIGLLKQLEIKLSMKLQCFVHGVITAINENDVDQFSDRAFHSKYKYAIKDLAEEVKKDKDAPYPMENLFKANKLITFAYEQKIPIEIETLENELLPLIDTFQKIIDELRNNTNAIAIRNQETINKLVNNNKTNNKALPQEVSKNEEE